MTAAVKRRKTSKVVFTAHPEEISSAVVGGKRKADNNKHSTTTDIIAIENLVCKHPELLGAFGILKKRRKK